MRGGRSRTLAPPRSDAAADVEPNLRRYYAAHRWVNSGRFGLSPDPACGRIERQYQTFS